MRTFKGYVSVGLVGCTRSYEFEVDDEATDEEIEEANQDMMWSYIETWFEGVSE